MDRFFFERIARAVYGLWWVLFIAYVLARMLGA